MNSRPWIVIAAGAVSLGLAVVTVSVRRERLAAETSLALLEQRRLALAGDLARFNRRTSLAAAEAERLRATTGGTVALGAEAGGPQVVTIDPRTAAIQEEIARIPWKDVVLERSPELQARYLAVQKRKVAVTYGPFLVRTNLTAGQVERFKDIVAAEAEREMDLRSAVLAEGLADSSPESRALLAESRARERAELVEMVGQEGYQQFAEYERSLPMRDYVARLASSLVFAGTPLDAGQADQLTRILAENSEPYHNGGTSLTFDPDLSRAIREQQPARESFDSAQALEGARMILAPAQYEVFEAEVLRYREIVDLFNVIRQSPGDPVVGFTIIGRR